MTTYLHAKPAGTPTWIDLMTPDIDAGAQVLPCRVRLELRYWRPRIWRLYHRSIGQRTTVGMMGNQPGALPMPAAWSLYFATDNIEADVARAVKLGAKALYPPMLVGEFGSMATCEDPTGAAFSFWQAGQHIGSQVTNEPGSAAWYERYSSDAKQARDFYTALLGATADPVPAGMEYYVLKHGEQELCGIMQIDPAWGEFHPQWMTDFSVANTDDTVAVVTKHGGKVMGPIDDSPFGRTRRLGGPKRRILQDCPAPDRLIPSKFLVAERL